MTFQLRELGFFRGELQTGSLNSITDILGVLVGQVTLIEGEGALKPGSGPVRTGITIILPHSRNLFHEKVTAAVYTINGYGKAVGFEQVRELGFIEAPIALTNTFNVGLVLDSILEALMREQPRLGVYPEYGSVNIVVGETNDGYLNDIRGRHVRSEHVFQALKTCRAGQVEQGAVGAGTGTVCFDWKGGIGTSSRFLNGVDGTATLGVLVQSNYGRAEDLTVLGVPVGRRLCPPYDQRRVESGSVIVVLATDIPYDTRQLERLASRAYAGLALTGSKFSYGSGDFVIAFSTGRKTDDAGGICCDPMSDFWQHPDGMNLCFRGVIEAVEEAVLNSLTNAHSIIGRDDHMAPSIPQEPLIGMLHDMGKSI